MSRWCFLIGITLTLTFGQPCAVEDYLTAARLYADVARFASFGSHRLGSPDDRATTDWIAGELRLCRSRTQGCGRRGKPIQIRFDSARA
jgi:hypothetical protein